MPQIVKYLSLQQKWVCLLVGMAISIISAKAQQPLSIHQEHSELFSTYEGPVLDTEGTYYINMNADTSCLLERRVFGYHPYWMGSGYLNYQWHLLSDVCYFSYEVDPQTGYPLDYHEWLSTPLIDSANAHGVDVHLCVTLFSDHYTFFSSPLAQQNLINTVIGFLQIRDAAGVNLDFEAVPSSLSNELTDFLKNFSEQIHSNLPGTIVSIASPAVNWNNTFQLDVLKDYIDLFMIMTYDYYWNGSGTAGPVGGLYSMEAGYDYNVSRTISNYLSQGISRDKLIAGMPYYGRDWETQQQYAPSLVAGYGTALTYANIRSNSSGNYSPDNKQWEGNSFSPYYSYYEDGWNQCFVDDAYSLGKKYEVVNQRNIAGIGIWALGYDGSYPELWQAISDHFTSCAPVNCPDTIYDSGGPAFDYYNDEQYSLYLEAEQSEQITLSFSEFSLESGYDSLWVHDGPDTSYEIIGRFSGDEIPAPIQSSANALTLFFYSDGALTMPGWKAVYTCSPATAINELLDDSNDLLAYPNPFSHQLHVSIEHSTSSVSTVEFRDLRGALVKELPSIEECEQVIILNTNDMPAGVYFLLVRFQNGETRVNKIVKN